MITSRCVNSKVGIYSSGKLEGITPMVLTSKLKYILTRVATISAISVGGKISAIFFGVKKSMARAIAPNKKFS